MPDLIREPESRVVIRFQDCDPFGHLNNSRYLDYLINAREDHLVEAYGFDIYERAKTSGCNWVVARHQVAYLAPARYREQVLVRTSLRRYTERTVLVESRMHAADGVRLMALLWTEYAYVSLATGRPAPHGPEVLAFLESIVLRETAYPEDFAARERSLSGKGQEPPRG